MFCEPNLAQPTLIASQYHKKPIQRKQNLAHSEAEQSKFRMA